MPRSGRWVLGLAMLVGGCGGGLRWRGLTPLTLLPLRRRQGRAWRRWRSHLAETAPFAVPARDGSGNLPGSTGIRTPLRPLGYAAELFNPVDRSVGLGSGGYQVRGS